MTVLQPFRVLSMLYFLQSTYIILCPGPVYGRSITKIWVTHPYKDYIICLISDIRKHYFTDFSVLAGVTFTEVFDLDLSEFKNISSWVTKMKKLPYFEICNRGLYELKERLKQSQST